MADVDTIADSLYALTPEEFTTARDSNVVHLREVGEKDSAAVVAKLRKPTVAAWLANRLVRTQRDAVQELLSVGAALREAQSSLDASALRELTLQQRKVVDALVRRARTEAGRPVSDSVAAQLAETLQAALADAAAESRLRAGRLSIALKHSGGFSATAPARLSSVAAPTVDRALEAARARFAEATAAAVAARRDLAALASELAGARTAQFEAQEAFDEAKRELDAAKRAVTRIEGDHEKARVRLERAEAIVRETKAGQR